MLPGVGCDPSFEEHCPTLFLCLHLSLKQLWEIVTASQLKLTQEDYAVGFMAVQEFGATFL